MVAGILLFAALGAQPMPDLLLEVPSLGLAQLDAPSPTVNDWPVEPDRTRHKINLTAPIVMLSLGGVLMATAGLGVAAESGASCNHGDAFTICNLGPILSFGALSAVGGLFFLAGTVWLIIDLALNAQRVDAQPSPVADSPSAPKRRGPGLLVATF